MTHTVRALLLLLLLLPVTALATGPQTSATGHQALDDRGRVHVLTRGYYGALFPEGDVASPATPVLVLEIDGDAERHLIPGTAAAAEDTPRLILAEGDLITVLWQSLELPDRRALYLAQWDGSSWGQTFLVHEGALGVTTSPRIAVTRDRQSFAVDGETFRVARTVVHLIWQESIFGDLQVHYSPLVLAEGAYVGEREVSSLSQLYSAATLGAPPYAATATPQLGTALAVTPEGDDLTVAFADLPSGRLVSLRIRPTPLAVGLLGDAVRQAALDLGAELGTASPAFRDKMRAQIIGIGARLKLHPRVVDYLTLHTMRWLSSRSHHPLPQLADGLRDHAVEVSAALDSTDPPQAASVLEIDVAALLGEAAVAERVEVAIAAERPLPSTDPGPTTIFARGDSLAIAWHDEQAAALHYLESSEGGWRAQRTLLLGSRRSLAEGLELISARIP